MKTETKVWVMSQAPAGNWTQVMSSSDWSEPADAVKTVAWYRENEKTRRFAIALVTTIVFED